MEDVAGVNVMVQGLLDQVLGLKAGELRHPGPRTQEGEKEVER